MSILGAKIRGMKSGFDDEYHIAAIEMMAKSVDKLIEDLNDSKAEVSELKDYCNTLFQLAKTFIPMCPAKAKLMWEKAFERGRQLRCEGTTKLAKLEEELEQIKAEIQTCVDCGERYLAKSHEYPCPYCKNQELAELKASLKTEPYICGAHVDDPEEARRASKIVIDTAKKMCDCEYEADGEPCTICNQTYIEKNEKQQEIGLRCLFDKTIVCAKDEYDCAFCVPYMEATGKRENPDLPPCPHCGKQCDSWFSRTLPMGYFCNNCGGER